jgi:hypothetical protein
VRHAEDISWSDPFASVRTVYDKQGMELPALPRTRASTGVGAAAPQSESVALPNVGKEQHAYLTHIVLLPLKAPSWRSSTAHHPWAGCRHSGCTTRHLGGATGPCAADSGAGVRL